MMPQLFRAFVAYGVSFRLGASSESLFVQALQSLPYGSVPSGEGADGGAEFVMTEQAGRPYNVSLDGVLVSAAVDLPMALELLARDLMIHVANYAPEFVFLHAGVVGWEGSAIVLPGRSFAGKTTLVAALVRAGATYYSDEYAVIDQHGLIHPFARELQVRRPGESAQREVSVDELGGAAGVEPLRAGQVAFCEFSHAAQWAPRVMSPGMAVLEMLRHTIPVQRTPARAMAALSAMVAGASLLETARGDAEEAARWLLRLELVSGVRT
jgi:hypothetical protein